MIRRLVAISMVAVTITLLFSSVAFAQSKPEFKLGFKLLADQIPDIVGEPLENEHWGPNGDSLQQTSKGLMVWRKADNWTAFTNGSRTWINGPFGVQDRPNDERFDWEADDRPPAGSESPKAEEWNSYENAEYGFVVDLPIHWVEMPSDREALDSILGELRAENPDAADFLESQFEELTLIDYKFVGFDLIDDGIARGYAPNVALHRETLYKEITLDFYAEDSVATMEIIDQVIKPVEHRRVNLPVGPAEELRYQMHMTPLGKEPVIVSILQYLLVDGKNVYSFSMGAISDQFDAYLPFFEQIAQRFTLN